MKIDHKFKGQYKVMQADCIPFLETFNGSGAVITGIPDSKEINMTPEQWAPWFINTVMLCLDFVPKGVPAMFLQIDRKEGGRTISKLDLCMQAMRQQGRSRLLFDKIILRREVGKIDLYHVTFMHLICLGDETVKIGAPTPDVIYGGEKLWKWGIGIDGCTFACEFAKRFTDTIYDPFCGYGTVLKAANDLGMKSFGIDIDPERVEITERILRGEKNVT